MLKRKYKNQKIEVDGYIFDSRKEAARYAELKMLLRVGVIKNLCLQPSFRISPGGCVDPATGRKMPARMYTADFLYEEKGETVVEDVKSPITAKETAYRLRRQLFLEQYGDKYIFKEV